MKRWISSKHDSRTLIEQVEGSIMAKLDLPRSSQVENIEPAEGVRFVILDANQVFVSLDSGFVPFVGSPAALGHFPSLTIDYGAVKFIMNGADVMRPGVVSYDDWGDAGKMLVVRESQKSRSVAVGKSLLTSDEMARISKGPCVKNLHYAGDRIWQLYRQV